MVSRRGFLKTLPALVVGSGGAAATLQYRSSTATEQSTPQDIQTESELVRAEQQRTSEAYAEYGPSDKVLELEVTAGKPKHIETFDQFALVVGEGLSVIDISDPLNPSEIGSLSSSVIKNGYGAAVGSGYVFITALTGNIHAVDLSDPTDPREVSRLSVGKPRKPTVYGDTLFASSAKGVANFYAIDISDPTDLSLRSRLHDPVFDRSFEVSVDNDIAFVAGRRNEVLVAVDVASPESPEIIGTFEDPELVEPYGVEVRDGIAYVTCSEGGNGLMTVDVSDSSSMAKIGYLETAHTIHPYGLFVEGDYATIAPKDGMTVTTIDVSSPSSMSEVGYYPTSGTMYDVELLNGFVFGACRSGGTMTVGGWM